MLLHLFNPSHDEALASATPYYTETQAARRLAGALWALPACWAAPGDALLVPDGCGSPLPEALFPGASLRLVRWDGVGEFLSGSRGRIEPWGWNAALAHRLRRAGVPEELLPDAGRLAAYRELASRKTAVALLHQLKHDFPALAGDARWCTDMDEVAATVRIYGTAMLKAPWSGSGRGVFQASPDSGDAVWRRASRLLREQGALSVEPFYKRLADFALEYSADGRGGIRYEGISVFRTNPSGGYSGNLVADEGRLLQELPGVSPSLLLQVRHAQERLLSGMLGDSYAGPLGVDMMVVEGDGGVPLLHPCVEVNLRHTMGHVVLHLRPFVPAGQCALFRIQPFPAAGDLPGRLLAGGGGIGAFLSVCRP